MPCLVAGYLAFLSLSVFAGRAYAVDGTLKWIFETGSYVESSPAIGPDGTIYVGSKDHHLYAINPDGSLKWSYQTGSKVTSSPALGEDGTIYVGSWDHHLYALESDGTLKWRLKTDLYVHSSPAIGQDGTIYVGSWDNYLYAVNPNGSLKWRFLTEGWIHSSPAVGEDGTVYIGSRDGGLYAINPDGTQKWVIFAGDYLYASPAIAADGTIYIGSWDGFFYAVNPDGTLKWAKDLYGVESSAAVAPDGTIYVGAWGKILYALNPDSTIKWQLNTDWVSISSPAIGADGTIYIGTGDLFNIVDSAHLYAINPDGTEKWAYETPLAVFTSSPTIGNDSTVYVGCIDHKLYAINDSSGGLTKSAWPMFRANLRHTGRVEAPIPDIKANDDDGPVMVSRGDPLKITITLNPGSHLAELVDRWCLADTPFGWYYYNGTTGTWQTGFQVSYQGPLEEISPPLEVLNRSDLPTGTYVLYFGVDMIKNGLLNPGKVYYDSVLVEIIP